MSLKRINVDFLFHTGKTNFSLLCLLYFMTCDGIDCFSVLYEIWFSKAPLEQLSCEVLKDTSCAQKREQPKNCILWRFRTLKCCQLKMYFYYEAQTLCVLLFSTKFANLSPTPIMVFCFLYSLDFLVYCQKMSVVLVLLLHLLRNDYTSKTEPRNLKPDE